MLDMTNRQSKPMSTEKRVLGYVRVSTESQADSGASLISQTEAIKAEVARNGWTLLAIIEDAGLSAKSMNRPGLIEALGKLRKGDADILMAAKLDRLSRSTKDVCELGDMAKHYGFDLCLLDARIDTTTPHGRAQLSMMATFAQLERELCGQRTKEALAVKAAAGVRLGRRVQVEQGTTDMILKMRTQGMTLRAIADQLNRDGLRTGHGGNKWHASTVNAILGRSERVAA